MPASQEGCLKSSLFAATDILCCNSSAKGMHLQAGPLLKLQCRCLFAHGDRDPLCPVERLTQAQQEMAQPCQNIVIQVLSLLTVRG